MDTDDLEPPKAIIKPKDLEVMSVEALGEYIEEMEAEIARVRDAIATKKTAHESASSVFKS